MGISKEKFYEILRENASEEFAHIPTEKETSCRFSPEFIQKMDKLIKKQKRTSWSFFHTPFGRIAAVTLTACILLLLIIGYGHLQKPFTEEYVILNLPEGFTQAACQKEKDTVTLTYENDKGEKIVLQQYSAGAITGGAPVYGTMQAVAVGDKTVYVYQIENGARADWIQDGYAFSLIYYGQIDTEALVSFASSVSPSP